MKIGYARVSTFDQHEELQIDALNAAGCGKIFKDKASGSKADRKGWGEAMEYLRKGDTLVVWRLDRAGRSLKHLVEMLMLLNEKGVDFVSVTEHIDTTTPGGKLIFHIFAALAEFERELIRERTRAGLEAARARGRMGGRPRKLQTKPKIEYARFLHSQQRPITEICAELKISRATLYRYLNDK